MHIYKKIGLKKELINNIKQIVKKYHDVDKVVIFGSRAIGCYKKNSDIDLALFGKNIKEFFSIQDNLEENLNTPMKLDVVLYSKIKKKKLKNNILKEGKIIYERKKNK
jgi:uncharacterized protein